MKVLNCSICGVRVDIPSHASAYVDQSVTCPSCLARRSKVGKIVGRAIDQAKASPWIAWALRRKTTSPKRQAIDDTTELMAPSISGKLNVRASIESMLIEFRLSCCCLLFLVESFEECLRAAFHRRRSIFVRGFRVQHLIQSSADFLLWWLPRVLHEPFSARHESGSAVVPLKL